MSTPKLPKGMKDTARNQVANQLHSAAIHLLRRARLEDRNSGLSPERLSVLSVLAFAGPRTASELADIEMVSRPAITRILQGLESSGHIRRERSEDDRRAWIVHVTASGRNVIEVARRRRVQRIADELESLSPEDLQLLGRAVSLLEVSREK